MGANGKCNGQMVLRTDEAGEWGTGKNHNKKPLHHTPVPSCELSSAFSCQTHSPTCSGSFLEEKPSALTYLELGIPLDQDTLILRFLVGNTRKNRVTAGRKCHSAFPLLRFSVARSRRRKFLSYVYVLICPVLRISQACRSPWSLDAFG